MRLAETDSHVACPVVFDEYMRASGFFYANDDQVYLVTARHNFLPMDSATLDTGESNITYTSSDTLTLVDIYLRGANSCTVKRLDLRDLTGIRYSENVDAAAIPLPFDPESFGYHVWTEADLVSPEHAAESLEIIGFPGRSFPDHDVYDVGDYCSDIQDPSILDVENIEFPDGRRTELCGLAGFTWVVEFVGEDEDYNGYSGSPVIGDGLVGIHTGNMLVESRHFEENGDTMTTLYWRADILKQLLD